MIAMMPRCVPLENGILAGRGRRAAKQAGPALPRRPISLFEQAFESGTAGVSSSSAGILTWSHFRTENRIPLFLKML
jgi:hypothetical protein